LKIDRYVRDIIKSLNNGNNNNNNNNEIIKDEEYYLDIGEEPPRFAYYSHMLNRIPKTEEERMEKLLHYQTGLTTKDELNFHMKKKLRIPAEERYQHNKNNWFFHESSYCYRGLEKYDGQGCNAFTGCIPECRYYQKYGRIEDEEIIQDFRELEESYRKENKLVDNIEIDNEDYIRL
jgi:hypothetical protein